MCRIVAVRAAGPVPLYRLLIGGDNSFAVQSLEHPDGWGLAYYEGPRPTVVKSVLPAICDELFEEASFSIAAPIVLAHIRRASVGPVSRKNCHPFSRGSWIFAHNGEIQAMDRVRGALVEAVAPSLRGTLEGETDSELYFLLFLSALAERVSLDEPTPPSEALAEAMGATLRLIRERVAEVSEEGPVPSSALTCVASNGEVMFGLSVGRALSLRVLDDALGAPAVMFSSEAIGTKRLLVDPASWQELAEDELVVVRPDLEVVRLPAR